VGISQNFASPSGLRYVDVNLRLLAGKEEQAKRAFFKMVGDMGYFT